MNKINIIFIIADSISYKYSWLKSKDHFPKLYKAKKNFKNFHNHYAVSHNSRANIGTLMSGVLPSLHKVINRKQKYIGTNIKFIGQKLKDHKIETHYLLNQSLGSKDEQIRDEFHPNSFNSVRACTPSLAEYNIEGKKFNKIIYKKLNELRNKNYCFFIHTTDAHEPFQAPNINFFYFFSKKLPLHRNFIFENIKNLNVLRRIKYKYFYKERRERNKIFFNNFSSLKENVSNIDLSIFHPTKFPNYYENVFSNKNFFKEYLIIHQLASNYQDTCINNLLEHIKNKYKKNTLIVLTSDHGTNAFFTENNKDKHGVLSKETIHIPFSILSFDEGLNDKIILKNNIFQHTSHLDVHSSILSLYNTKYSYESQMLFNLFFESDENTKSRYLFAEAGDSRLSFNEIKMFNEFFNLHIQLENTDIIEKLIIKEKILNEIEVSDYETYKLYKTKLNDYLNKISSEA